MSDISPGDQSVDDISASMFRKLCKELSGMGTKYAILIGEGEPLLHSQLIELVDAAKENGMHVTLLTNGTLLDEKKIKSFVQAKLDVLKVSLWGSTAEEYEKNHPQVGQNYFHRIVAGLKRTAFIKQEMRSPLPTVILHQPITKYNVKGIGKAIDLVQKTGSNALSFSPLKSWRGALDTYALSSDETKNAIVTLDQVGRRLEGLGIKHNIAETIIRYKKGEAVWRSLPCYMGWLNARIKVDGTVLPCASCYLTLGNISETRFSDIWNGNAYKSFRRNARTCEGLSKMHHVCDCGFCCHVEQNMKVHRLFKWFSPLYKVSWKS
jgi:MoaA/NifB/PqqE/SkfB family radical SAM enzyme